MKTSALHQLYDSLGQLIEQIQLNTDASDSANEIDIYPNPTSRKEVVLRQKNEGAKKNMHAELLRGGKDQRFDN